MSTVTLRKIASYLIYASLITPLLVLPGQFLFPFVVPKALFFRALMVLVGLAVGAVWFYERKNSAPRQNFLTPLSAAMLLTLVSLVLSTVFSVDWRSSLWNGHERMLGAFTIAHYFILFFASRYLFTTYAQWRRVFLTLAGVGAVAMLVAVIQKISPESFLNRGQTRVVSTLGNPIYVAGFALYLFFSGVFFALKERGWQRWWFAASALLSLVGIFLTQTRGTFLGLIGGLGLAAVMYLFLNYRRFGRSTKTAILIFAGAFFALAGAAFVFRQTNFVRSVPLLGSVVNISPAEGTAKTRLMAWGVAIKGFYDHPLLGWGPNNFAYAFNRHYNPKFLEFGFQETWFDNAHNALFNTLATQGLLGALAYLGLFGAAGWCLIKIYRADAVKGQPLLIIGGAFLAGHFIHNFFVFENLNSYLYLFLFLAFLDAQQRVSPVNFVAAENKRAGGAAKIPPGALILILVLSCVVVFITDVNVALANNYIYKMRGHAAVVGDYQKGLNYYQAAGRWRSPHQDDLNWEFSAVALEVLPDLYTRDIALARQWYDRAAAGLEQFVRWHPLDVRGRLTYTDVLRGGMVLFDLDNRAAVEEQFKQAQALAPGRQQIDYSKITFLGGLGGTDELIAAVKLAQATLAQNPKVAESYYLLARIYVEARLWPYVLPVLDQAIYKGVVFADPVHLQFAAESYEREGRFRDALYWYDKLYQTTGDEGVKNKRDELSQLTQKPVPRSLDEFFYYRTSTFDNFTEYELMR